MKITDFLYFLIKFSERIYYDSFFYVVYKLAIGGTKFKINNKFLLNITSPATFYIIIIDFKESFFWKKKNKTKAMSLQMIILFCPSYLFLQQNQINIKKFIMAFARLSSKNIDLHERKTRSFIY